MDGNGRWAKKRLLPRFIGHQKGLNAVKRIVSHCSELGVEALTLFAFSTENWRRPEDEVNKLMGLFLKALQKEVSKLDENNVKLRIIGDRTGFNEEIQAHIELAEERTSENTGLSLNIAANYGGRWDMIEAVKKWHAANPDKDIVELTEDELSGYVCLADLPEPDLLIRTGGEQRISNFLIWQMAYTEFFFTDTLWPDFNESSIDEAVSSFTQRERRFGKTGDQVK
ncbi:polyprenyl diphosphate synthase [Thiomicrorhabdus sp.]|uniref:polyprenyl diphosphate synthase n=1 Tax=Thiomicrorhabdus sp. TaxID=2039724 RepID=UPI0035624648